MNIEELSFRECLLVGRRAEHRCARRFQDLAARLPDSEAQAARLLTALAAEERSHEEALGRLERMAELPLLLQLDEAEIERTLKEHFPTLSGLGKEGPVDGRVALDAVRRIEEESARFYRDLLRRAPDPVSRRGLEAIAAQELRHAEDAFSPR